MLLFRLAPQPPRAVRRGTWGPFHVGATPSLVYTLGIQNGWLTWTYYPTVVERERAAPKSHDVYQSGHLTSFGPEPDELAALTGCAEQAPALELLEALVRACDRTDAFLY